MSGNQESSNSESYFSQLEDRVGGFLREIPESVHQAFRRHRRSAFEKHPFLFSTLGLIGLVATWQGFDDVLEHVSFFDRYPGSLLFIGLLILLLTGRLYREIDRQE